MSCSHLYHGLLRTPRVIEPGTVLRVRAGLIYVIPLDPRARHGRPADAPSSKGKEVRP